MPPNADRLPSLTGLRFVAAFAVFGFHIVAEDMLAPGRGRDVFEAVFGGGSAGVGFFYILSGFVLTWSARPADSVRMIWQRRAARIVPNHVVAWAIALAALLYAGNAVLSLWSLPSLLLVQAWFPTERVYFAVNTPSWSLSCEMAFYAAFPFLLPLVRRIAVERLWRTAALLIAGVLLVPAVALPMPKMIGYWFIWVFPGTRVLEFILGMVLARIVREDRWIHIGLWLPTGLVLAGYAVAAHVPAGFGFVAVTVIPFALLVPAAAAADLRGTRTPWCGRGMVLLGELSFAFYLLHQIVIRGVDHALGQRQWSFGGGLVVGVVMLLVALGASWVLHRVVELPAARRFAPRRRKAVVTGGTAPGSARVPDVAF